VNGTNPDSPDYEDDYIALNLESGSILTVLGNFEYEDNIIEKTSPDRALINLLTSSAPVAIGKVAVYETLPPGDEENGTLRNALTEGKKVAAVDSPVKVADTAAEVAAWIEDVVTRSSAKWYTQRLLYSGDAALGDSTNKLSIPAGARIIITRKVTQDKDVTITKHTLGTNGSNGTGGTLEIAAGALITVQPDRNNKPAKLELDATSLDTTELKVVDGGILAVVKGGTIDLSDAATNKGKVSLYGEIKAETGGILALPSGYKSIIAWGPQPDTVLGKITLAANSVAGTGRLATSTPYYPTARYIGPVVASQDTAFDYTWDATNTASAVTLVGPTLTLDDGKLSVTKPTASGAVSIASGEAVVVEKGILTVETGLELATGAKLSVADGASVVVQDTAILNLLGLDVDNTTTPHPGDRGAVTLAGTIEVEDSGTINLPSLAATGADKYKIVEINYAGGAIKLNYGSTATLDKDNDGGEDAYVGDTGTSPWTWDSTNVPKSFVELKADGEFVVTGNLTSTGTGNENTILTKLTVNGSNSTLKVPAGSTLKLDKDGILDVKNGGTILLAKNDGVAADVTTDTGGKLDLSELNNVTGTGFTVNINGSIVVEKNGHLTYPNWENSHWTYGSTGKATIKWGGRETVQGDLFVGPASSGAKFTFDTDAGNDAVAYVQSEPGPIRFGGKITLNSNDGIPAGNTWIVTQDAKLALATGVQLNVTGELHLVSGGSLEFKTGSYLWLEENTDVIGGGRLKLGSAPIGHNTVVRARSNPNHERGGWLNVTGITASGATATISLQQAPTGWSTVSGASVAAVENYSDATITTGQTVAAATPVTIYSETPVVTSTSSTPIPTAPNLANMGFGAGVKIGDSTITVGLSGAIK
jgi:hypothetical protein